MNKPSDFLDPNGCRLPEHLAPNPPVTAPPEYTYKLPDGFHLSNRWVMNDESAAICDHKTHVWASVPARFKTILSIGSCRQCIFSCDTHAEEMGAITKGLPYVPKLKRPFTSEYPFAGMRFDSPVRREWFEDLKVSDIPRGVDIYDLIELKTFVDLKPFADATIHRADFTEIQRAMHPDWKKIENKDMVIRCTRVAHRGKGTPPAVAQHKRYNDHFSCRGCFLNAITDSFTSKHPWAVEPPKTSIADRWQGVKESLADALEEYEREVKSVDFQNAYKCDLKLAQEAGSVGKRMLTEGKPTAFVERVRNNFAAFCEYVGQIKLSPVQREWCDLLERNEKKGEKDLLFWHFKGAGSTTIFTVLRTVWELGKDPKASFLIANLSEEAAVNSLNLVYAAYKNERFYEIFPSLRGVVDLLAKVSLDWPGRKIYPNEHNRSTHLVCDQYDAPMAEQKLSVRTKTGAKRLIFGEKKNRADFMHRMSKQIPTVRSYALIQDRGKNKGRNMSPENFPESKIEALKAELGKETFDRLYMCRLPPLDPPLEHQLLQAKQQLEKQRRKINAHATHVKRLDKYNKNLAQENVDIVRVLEQDKKGLEQSLAAETQTRRRLAKDAAEYAQRAVRDAAIIKSLKVDNEAQKQAFEKALDKSAQETDALIEEAKRQAAVFSEIALDLCGAILGPRDVTPKWSHDIVQKFYVYDGEARCKNCGADYYAWAAKDICSECE